MSPEPSRLGGRIPPGQTLHRGFPILHAGTVPTGLTRHSWTLSVSGEVGHPFRLSFADLQSLPNRDEVVDIHCVTGWSKLDTRWEGVPFRILAERADPSEQARYVIVECEQGFTTSLPIETLMEEDVMLAHSYEGEALALEHGGPVRLLVPRRYFYKSAKWLRGLRFASQDEPGFWEVRGYSNVADPWRELRYEVDDLREIHAMRKRALFRPIVR